MGPVHRRNSTRSKPERAAKLSRRKPALSRLMSRRSAAANLQSIRQRLEVARAAAVVTSAGMRCLEADIVQDAAATTLRRCVCDEIDRQVSEIGWIITALVGVKEGAKRGAS
jgi:hypothetical protein